MNVLLNHMKSMSDPFELSIQRLSQKVVTLLALSNADRASDIYLLNIEHMRISDCEAKFQVAGLSKTRRSGPPRGYIPPLHREGNLPSSQPRSIFDKDQRD